VVVRRARLLDIGLDEVAVRGDVFRAGFESAQHLYPLSGLATDLQHPNLVDVADPGVDHPEVAVCLEADPVQRGYTLFNTLAQSEAEDLLESADDYF